MSNRIDRSRIKASLMAIATALGIIAASSVLAAPDGPVYPAPGGNSWSGSGGPLGTATVEWKYTGFDSSAYSNLYWGPWSDGVISIATDGSADNRKFGTSTPATEILSLSLTCGAGCAEGTGDTWLHDSANGFDYHVATLFTLTLKDLSNNAINFVTDSSLGLTTSGVIADVTAAANAGGFTAGLSSKARLFGTSNAWQPTNSFFDGFNAGCGGNCTRTTNDFSSGFFSTSPVPEPETYAMMLAGLGLLGLMARRRKQKKAA